MDENKLITLIRAAMRDEIAPLAVDRAGYLAAREEIDRLRAELARERAETSALRGSLSRTRDQLATAQAIAREAIDARDAALRERDNAESLR